MTFKFLHSEDLVIPQRNIRCTVDFVSNYIVVEDNFRVNFGEADVEGV